MATEQLTDPQPLNVYVHTPYCIQRCSYCYYKTINLRGSEKSKRMDRYVDALCKEIELCAPAYHLQDRPVVTIYFGGGTPSLLSEDQLQRIVRTLRANLPFANPEFTVEAEPVTLTEEKAAAIMALGANRISMGVQSFDDAIIKGSHRLDDEKKAMKAITIAKATGAVINIDLMSGLAGETNETWKHSVQTALASEVENITVYKTELYGNTEYYRGVRNQTLELPSDDEELQYMHYAMSELTAANYTPWLFFTFNRQAEHRHRHPTNIFHGGDCFAVGTSAFGRLGDYLYQNNNDEEQYITALEAGQLTVQRGYYLTSLDQMVRGVVLGMKLVMLDLAAFQKRHGVKLESLCADAIAELITDGFITLVDREIRLTPKGILYGDYTGKRLAQALMKLQQ